MIDRMLNAGIILLICEVLWKPVTQFGVIDGVPFNIISAVIAFGVWFMLEDISDYQQTPKVKSIAIGALLAPFWLFLRPLIK